MRLNKIHIENFGKLSSYDLDLQDGLVSVMEENGWGKSTLAAFLRVMFYGLAGERKHGFTENERTRYTPWNKGTFGGWIEFESGGKRYLLTRNFGKKEKDCTFRLQDAETLLDSKDFSENIGEELFGIDRESYSKTSFIDHAAIHYEGINSAIGSKVGAISQTDDLNHYDDAMVIIKNYLNGYSPTAKKGKLYQLNDEIHQLERDVESKKTIEDRAEGLKQNRDQEKEKLEGLKQERETLQKELTGLSLGRTKTLNLKRLKELEEMAESRKRAVKEREESFHGRIPTRDELQELDDKTQETERKSVKLSGFVTSNTSERLDRLTRYFRNGVPKQEEIAGQIENCNELQNLFQRQTGLEDQENAQKQKLDEFRMESKRLEAAKALESADKKKQVQKKKTQKRILCGICFGAGVLLAIVCTLMKWNALVWVLAAVLFLIGVVILFQGNRASDTSEIEQVSQEQILQRQMDDCEKELKRLMQEHKELDENAKEMEHQIKDFLESMEISYSRADAESLLYEMKSRAVEFGELQKEREETELQRKELSEDAQKCSQELGSFLAQLGLTLEASDFAGIKRWIAETSQQLTNLDSERQEEKMALEASEAFRNAHPELKDLTDVLSEEEIKGREETLTARASEISEEESSHHEIISSYNRELEELFGKLEEIAECQGRVEDLKETQEKETSRYQLVKKTQEYLQVSKEQFIAKFMKPVKDAFDAYYKLLTNGKGDGGEFQIDANMNIFRKEEGEFRNIQAQSEGYADMIGLCIRMALLDVMYQDEKPMVIMDDPFCALDQNNLTGAKMFLDKLAEKYQILYLTCHQSRGIVKEEL